MSEHLPERLRSLAWYRRRDGSDRLMKAAADLIDEQAAEIDESTQLIDRLSALLTGTANALKGSPDALTLHDWSDLPEVSAQAVRSRDAAVFAVQCFLKTGDSDSMRVFLEAGGWSIEPDHDLMGGATDG